jgi:hypothetical protein
MVDRIIVSPRHIRPFLNRERRRGNGIISNYNRILTCTAGKLVTALGLGFEDEVQPAISVVTITVAANANRTYLFIFFASTSYICNLLVQNGVYE